jgi:DNA-binding NarL/FixJ family response regulator
LPRSFRGEFLGYRGLLSAAIGATEQAEDAIRAALECEGYIATSFLCDLGRAITALQTNNPQADSRCVEALTRTMSAGHYDVVITAARTFPELVRSGARDPDCARGLTRVLSLSSDIDLGRRAGLKMPRVLRKTQPLSPRERDVYELVVQGRSNKEIAHTLFISESTTKVHVRHIYEKLGVHTRAEAARALVDKTDD